jgi:hypothetical protein
MGCFREAKGSSARGSRGVLLAEFVDATGRVDDFLLARIEGMAVGANFDLQVMTQGRLRLEGIAAGTGHGDFFVFRMRVGFHGFLSTGRVLPAGDGKKGAQSSGPLMGSQAQIPSDFYPQKVWITLWVVRLRGRKNALICAKPLAWSNNDHDVKAFNFSQLQGLYPATGLKHAVMPLFKGQRRGSCA